VFSLRILPGAGAWFLPLATAARSLRFALTLRHQRRRGRRQHRRWRARRAAREARKCTPIVPPSGNLSFRARRPTPSSTPRASGPPSPSLSNPARPVTPRGSGASTGPRS
jgi:hypothetical protein